MNKNTDDTNQAVPLNDKDLDQINGGISNVAVLIDKMKRRFTDKIKSTNDDPNDYQISEEQRRRIRNPEDQTKQVQDFSIK